ncbi:MAG TPA: hypothetical protein VE869_02950 [Gemmatimonas sp.]|nr:hypothetical protein [Gemmatimonas sp.]
MPDSVSHPQADDLPSEDELIHDEYTDPALENVHELDALDVPSALRDESVLEGVADSADGIESIDLAPSGDQMDTIDTGARHRSIDDEGDMGFGGEPRTIEELEAAAIGTELRGRGGRTRDDEVHGEALFDSPDDVDDDEDEDEVGDE